MPDNTAEEQQSVAQEAQKAAEDHDSTSEQEQAAEKASVVEERESNHSQERSEEDDPSEEEDSTDDASRDRDAEKLVAKLRKKNTENQKLRARATDAESKLMRFEVASELGLPLHLAERLKGDSREALKADAEEFLQHISPASVLGFVPDDGRRTGVQGDVKTPSLSEIGERIYER